MMREENMINRNVLVIGNQVTIYIGLVPDIGAHAHSTAVIALSLNEEEISARANQDGIWATHQAYFLPANINNEMRQFDNPIACIFIEPDSDCYQQYLKMHSFKENQLSPYLFNLNKLRNLLSNFANNPTCPNVLSTSVVEIILGSSPPPKLLDDRVVKCAKAIKQNIDENLSAHALANMSDLSERQLSALFKRDMGLPIRKYRLWLRLKNAVQLVDKGYAITDAALASGFSDSAHFANSCRKLLGLKPTAIMEINKPLLLLATSEFI